MTLARRIVLKNAALLGGLLVLACVATWGLLGLSSAVRTVLVAYRELQRIESAETSITATKGALMRGQTSGRTVLEPLQSAEARLNDFLNVDGYDYASGDAALAIANVRQAAGALGELIASAQEPAVAPPGPGQSLRLESMNRRADDALALLHEAATACDQFIRAQESATNRRFRATLLSVGSLSMLILVTAVYLSISQYRSVVLPLRRLGQAVRKVADGQFQERVELQGDAEFAALVFEFNKMAGKLDDFYQRLEEKVAVASRELVRSERLASVGFLAAGVAHEINNPLNIISGYAELSLKRLASERAESAARGIMAGPATRTTSAAAPVDHLRSLQIIRDEAFRCKQITQKLLSLARGGGGEERVPVSLPRVAAEVAEMVGGLSQYRDRRLLLEFEDSRSLVVMGNITEIKQVLLNLTVNALEATSVGGGGEVRIQARRAGNGSGASDGIELLVRDNGRGMSPETVERAFEPFYTEKRGAGDRGTGLGLTITHAIIENHGGQIKAESDGPGRGSRFVIRLPAAGPSPRGQDAEVLA